MLLLQHRGDEGPPRDPPPARRGPTHCSRWSPLVPSFGADSCPIESQTGLSSVVEACVHPPPTRAVFCVVRGFVRRKAYWSGRFCVPLLQGAGSDGVDADGNGEGSCTDLQAACRCWNKTSVPQPIKQRRARQSMRHPVVARHMAACRLSICVSDFLLVCGRRKMEQQAR